MSRNRVFRWLFMSSILLPTLTIITVY